MSKVIKDKANLELVLKNILYYIEDEQEQAKMIAILERYNIMISRRCRYDRKYNNK